MKNIIKLTALISVLALSSCNKLASTYGGTITIELEKDQKLVNCSWKKDFSLWVLTRTRRQDEVPETYKYTEKSNLSIVEGTVIIIEK